MVLYFYPRSPCGERHQHLPQNLWRGYFYPRSPCGERLLPRCRRWKRRRFLSTLSLRRATCSTGTRATSRATFLSTLSLRRATASKALCATAFFLFLSTLSLRRATVHYDNYNLHCVISIHALLAESDQVFQRIAKPFRISIHALLAESDAFLTFSQIRVALFLSTLSLRRATSTLSVLTLTARYFYPRSPCGERLHYDNYNLHCVEISIHALLAESDVPYQYISQDFRNFYPRSPCGERPL